jgi:outer membrane autotransporter protein
MSDSKNRAGAPKRQSARVIKVAPVSRAIRAALAVSATTLALTASGAVFAGNGPASLPTVLHHQASPSGVQQPVMDLTTVTGDHVGSVSEPAASSAASSRSSSIESSTDLSTASQQQTFGDVHDLMTVAAFSGGSAGAPGGVSGSDDSVHFNWNYSGTSGESFATAQGSTVSATSTTGIADDVFMDAASVVYGHNQATLDATGSTWAAGIEVEASDYALSIVNGVYGTINSSTSGSHGEAWGVYAFAGNDARVYNDGTINASESGKYGSAVGLYAGSPDGVASADNTGTINATASGKYGNAWGVYATGGDGATISNSGVISVGATGISANGTGMSVNSYAGAASASNSGDITVSALFGDATGINGASSYGDISIDNASGAGISVTSIGGSVTGIFGQTYSGGVSLANEGSISASSMGGDAIGLYGYSVTGDVSIGSTGSITATSIAGLADGIFASGTGVEVTNGGSIDANGYSWAAGIEAQGTDLTTVGNAGVISAVTTDEYGQAFGVYATGDTTGAVVSNTGSIYATASYYGTADGVFANGGAGTVSIDNGGAVYAAGYYANGVVAVSGGAIDIDNSGAISAYNAALATGISATNNYAASDITVTSSGSIYAYGAYGGTGIDVAAIGAGSSVGVTNDGSIYAGQASYYGYGATGILASGDADATIGNAGDITVVSGGGAYGAMALAFNGDATVTSSGDITANGYVGVGIVASSSNGGAIVDNGGSIAVQAYYIGAGIQANGVTGVTVTNSGAISVKYAAYAYGASGIAGNGDVAISNAGSIGVLGYGFGIGEFGLSTYGNVSLDNSNYILAASVGQAVGEFARSDYGDVSAHNSGAIVAYSVYGPSVGAFARAASGDAAIDNGGSIQAVSVAGDSAGIRASGLTAEVSNSAEVYGISQYGQAVGIDLYGADSATVNNDGLVVAQSYAAGAIGVAAYGISGVHVTNSGTISAESAIGSQAYGVVAAAYGDVLVENSGAIHATDGDFAVGVSMDSTAGIAALVNTGIVRTYSTLEGQVAVLGGDGVQHVVNYGNVYGALITAGGDDAFTNGNGGVWHVNNNSTDFGDGDDAITNGAGGTIVLANGSLHLGSSSSAGNSFINNGIVRVQGVAGLVDMGSGSQALVPSLNALPLMNNGLIDFVDGSPDDMLTIAGDLGGSGALNVDISPLNLTSDLLYVDGSIADGAVQTVNVDFTGLPAAGSSVDPIVFAHVTGNSSAGAFVGGQVVGYGQNNFLDLRVNVTSAIDSTNAGDDVFSLGVEVAGLSDAGTLGASIASGAQSLLASQIGTWRQRMGVLPQKSADNVGLSPWIRAFTSSGEMSPGHASNFGADGSFNYDQNNTGSEFGANVNIRGGLNVGLLLATADGSQHLKGGGVGSDHIHGSAFGLYATWIADNGFYVDASYRWLDFDAKLRSSAGQQSTDGQGGAFNVEAGLAAWTLAGVNVTPQAQYTRSQVGNIRPLQGDQTDFRANGGTSSRGRLGVEFSKTINAAGWAWTPYGSVNAIREFDGRSSYSVADTFTGSTSTEGTSAMLDVGLGLQKKGLSITGGANWTDGGALKRFVGGQLVMRYTW